MDFITIDSLLHFDIIAHPRIFGLLGKGFKKQETVNWAQLSNRRYVDTDMLPGSYPHRKYIGLYARKHHEVEMRENVTDAGQTTNNQ